MKFLSKKPGFRRILFGILLGVGLEFVYFQFTRPPLSLSIVEYPHIVGQETQLSCTITNVSYRAVTFGMWNCDYEKNWSLLNDGKKISLPPRECFRNFVERTTLLPGQRKTVVLAISPLFRSQLVFHPEPIPNSPEESLNQDFTSDEVVLYAD